MKSGIFTNNTSFSVTAANVAMPTGSTSVTIDNTINFTVPSRVTVLFCTPIKDGKPQGRWQKYVGVTPGKTYPLVFRIKPPGYPPIPPAMSILQHVGTNIMWVGVVDEVTDSCTISWSPEINKQTPDIKDY